MWSDTCLLHCDVIYRHIEHSVLFYMPYHKMPNKLSMNYVAEFSFFIDNWRKGFIDVAIWGFHFIFQNM